jgi:hypothetical protein
MFLNDFLLIYAKKLLFPELCKKDLLKKRFLFLGSLRGVPLNVRVYPLMFGKGALTQSFRVFNNRRRKKCL